MDEETFKDFKRVAILLSCPYSYGNNKYYVTFENDWQFLT